MSRSQALQLERLACILGDEGWYLAGGTALAIYLGHRRSVDLDWFAPALDDPLALAARIRDAGLAIEVRNIAKGTLEGTVGGVRISFMEYRYPMLRKTTRWKEKGVALASLDDLAAMKLSAVAQRGSRKDFIDIYALGTKHRPLPGLLRCYSRKFGIAEPSHVLYGLAWFEDAERERMPRMIERWTWALMKADIQAWVKDLSARRKR
ncbi:MAG: nucleotidyl transferase AbiEii/AbiGii toxin family protein [Candidatus Geothermincolia bacterium]